MKLVDGPCGLLHAANPSRLTSREIVCTSWYALTVRRLPRCRSSNCLHLERMLTRNEIVETVTK